MATRTNQDRPHWMTVVLAGTLLTEASILAAGAMFFAFQLFVDVPSSYPVAILIIVLLAIGAAWVVLIARGWLRGVIWARGATFMWQVLQIALAAGCFQGAFARPEVGWLLLIPALVATAMLFTRPIIEVTSRQV